MSRRDSLAHGAPPAATGTLHARSAAGGVTAGPEPGRVVRFGRGDGPETDLCVGQDDLRVSRQHGELTYWHGHWWLRNTGQQLLRLPPGRLMHASTEATPLPPGYTPLFVRGSGYREYLIELYVTDPARHPRRAPRTSPLSDDERLLLVVLGQRYLRHEPAPRPLSRRQASEQLRFLRPDGGWEAPAIERRVADVRARLARGGALPSCPPLPGVGGQGAGEARLLHSLLKGLVDSATLVPPDLALLDADFDA